MHRQQALAVGEDGLELLGAQLHAQRQLELRDEHVQVADVRTLGLQNLVEDEPPAHSARSQRGRLAARACLRCQWSDGVRVLGARRSEYWREGGS